MSQLEASPDTEPAGWIVAALQTFGRTVLGLVPAGFAAYVRVFHPAYQRADDGALTPVSWRSIAEANGRHAHPAMQLIPLTGEAKFIHSGQPGVYDLPPREGSLPPELVAPLLDVLTRHTTTSDQCWFAVWNGFGAARADVQSAPIFHVPTRDYHLLAGPIEAAAETALNPPWKQSPNLWWPDDRSWCVATEIDLNTTYIGCDELCSREILALPELEAEPVAPDDGITWKSDPVNPWPEPK